MRNFVRYQWLSPTRCSTAILCVALWNAALDCATAQQIPSPQKLNDCTFLTDPARLKECIDENKGLVPETSEPSIRRSQPILKKDSGVFRERVSTPHLLDDSGVFREPSGPRR